MAERTKSERITEILRLAAILVLETPARSQYATQSYVRRSLIALLEAELTGLGYDFAELRKDVRAIERARRKEAV